MYNHSPLVGKVRHSSRWLSDSDIEGRGEPGASLSLSLRKRFSHSITRGSLRETGWWCCTSKPSLLRSADVNMNLDDEVSSEMTCAARRRERGGGLPRSALRASLGPPPRRSARGSASAASRVVVEGAREGLEMLGISMA